VQVDAPGVSVYSTYINGQYGRLSGTSMATPHVAGLAALALSANPSLTAAELRALIVEGANRTIGGSDSEGGINAALTVALAAAGQTSSSSSAAAVQAASAAQSVPATRRFVSSSVDGPSPWADTHSQAESQTSPDTTLMAQAADTRAAEDDSLRAARDRALLAMSTADGGYLDDVLEDLGLDTLVEAHLETSSDALCELLTA
jgi:subtilisin family serine protease